MTDTKDLKHVKIWRGIHRGIHYEIKQHSFDMQEKYDRAPTWNTYINLSEREHPEWMERLWSNEIDKYSNDPDAREPSDIFNKLRWNGGQTFYKQTVFHDYKGNKFRHIQIGDDYAHSWDSEHGRDKNYNLEMMNGNIITIIDELFDIMENKIAE